MMKKPDFLHADTNSIKLKVDWRKLGWVMVDHGHKWPTLAPSGRRTLKLDLSHENIIGIHWFLVC